MKLVLRRALDVNLLLLAVALIMLILRPDGVAPSLAETVEQALPSSGVEHPVTAVLMNFRGYDTMLEMLVLLIALVAVQSLGGAPALPPAAVASPVLTELLQLLAPFLLLIAVYLLWRGSYGPGGAFQAGAVLGASGVLWQLTERQTSRGAKYPATRRALPLLGIGMFVAVGAYLAVREGVFLSYPADGASALIFTIEALASVSIAVTLVELFGGAPGGGT